jgi:hypothetical protein
MELITFMLNSWVVLTSNVKMGKCCPQLRYFILMVRLYVIICCYVICEMSFIFIVMWCVQ